MWDESEHGWYSISDKNQIGVKIWFVFFSRKSLGLLYISLARILSILDGKEIDLLFKHSNYTGFQNWRKYSRGNRLVEKDY